MRKWRCVSVNDGNKGCFTVGKIYYTNDNGYGVTTDSGAILTNISLLKEMKCYGGKLQFIEVVEVKDFTKSDLKEGDIVVTRNDCKLVFFNKRFTNCTNVNSKLEKWEIDLIRKTSFNRLPEFDIMQVYRNGELIFERFEKSQKQIELEKLKENIKELEKRIEEMEKENERNDTN